MAGGRPIVIAGGGTAGHVNPALAVGRALVARGHRPEDILFVGSRRGLDAELVPAAGFPVVLLPGRGVVRRIGWQAVAAVGGIIAATVQATWLLARRRPAVILSVGGYAAAPAAFAALVLRIPLVVAEANAVPGAANRVAARWAKASAVAFAGTRLPRAVLTGNPVRAEVLARPSRSAARASYGASPGRVLIAVTGGSLGARRINDAVLELARLWAERGDVAIHHAIGARDWPELSAQLPTPSALAYRAVEYEDRVPDLLAAADLWIGRAGATTLAELTAVGVASILVPLPIAPNDHQMVGARQLEAAGAAVVIPDSELDGRRLAEVVGELLRVPGTLDKMGAAAASIGHPDAADRIAELLEEHRRG